MKTQPLPFPRLPYAGRMARLKINGTIEQCIEKASDAMGARWEINLIPLTSWAACWIYTDKLKGRAVEVEGERIGHPFLVRIARRTKAKDDKVYLDKVEEEARRFLFLGLDADTVDIVLEMAGVGGNVVYPRIDIDRLVHDLVTPPEHLIWPETAGPSLAESGGGRPYLLGSIYAGIEGYGRDLRSVGFFGDDLAEARLFKSVLKSLSTHRVGIRRADSDKEILSVSGKGDVSLQAYRGPEHLLAIDIFTTYMRKNKYIDWKGG